LWPEEEEGYNSRIDELQAALLEFMLAGLEEEVQQRTAIAEKYSKGLAGVGDIVTPVTRPDRDHRYYLYTVKTGCRDELKSYLAERGIDTRINYPYPIHLMRGYAFLGYKAGDLPVTERLATEIISLPMYGALPMHHVEKVIDSIKSFFDGK